jgi:hypothetical protein
LSKDNRSGQDLPRCESCAHLDKHTNLLKQWLCAKAGPPNFWLLAWERCLGKHWQAK